MTNYIEANSVDFVTDSLECKRYMRVEDLEKLYGLTQDKMMLLAYAAGAIYRLPRITLICRRKLEDYMKHLCRIPNTKKYIEKKYVRIGEASIIYGIGHHRIIELARNAGAVYKLSEGTVLISLEIFDGYMEQFHLEPIPLKNPLWTSEKK